jgi:hypothetical protein
MKFVGGGGGAAKTGVINRVLIFKHDNGKLIEKDTYSTEKLVPRTLKLVGPNSEKLILGAENQCFVIPIEKLKYGISFWSNFQVQSINCFKSS